MSLNWNSNPRSLGIHIDIHPTELLTQFYGTSQVFVYTTYLHGFPRQVVHLPTRVTETQQASKPKKCDFKNNWRKNF